MTTQPTAETVDESAADAGKPEGEGTGPTDLKRLLAQFPECRAAEGRFADGIPTAWVPRERIVDVCRTLRDEPDLEFKLLAELMGAHFPDRTEPFEINYILHSFRHNRRIRLKVWAAAEDPAVPSVVSVWPGANWLEREVFDMFGVRFDGHPDLRRILMPEDWEGHPLRKDFPLGEEPVEFYRSQYQEQQKDVTRTLSR